MRWETIRERVKQRIDEIGANMAIISRQLGHSDGFMHAFLVTGKQKSLKMQDIEKLSSILKVSDDWLLGLDDGDGHALLRSNGAFEKSMLEKSGVGFADVVSVGDVEKRKVMFAGLDILNGSCSIIDSGASSSQIVKGFIVDPILLKTNNAYLASFAGRSPITAWLKKVKLSNQDEIWFILNCDKL
jgi:hypothetical protein